MDIPVLVDTEPIEQPSTPDTPRIMDAGDVEWVTRLCRKKYPARFDWESTQAWYINIVLRSPMMFYPIRTRDAFVITMLSTVPWFPNDIDANVIFVCADDGEMWQALKLLRTSIEWAKRRRATVWRLSSDSDVDLRPLALRAGAKEIAPRFVLRFERTL